MTFKIIINGKNKAVIQQELYYDEILLLSGIKFKTIVPTITVTFSNADQMPEAGSLKKNQSVVVKNGTVIDVVDTSAA